MGTYTNLKRQARLNLEAYRRTHFAPSLWRAINQTRLAIHMLKSFSHFPNDGRTPYISHKILED